MSKPRHWGELGAVNDDALIEAARRQIDQMTVNREDGGGSQPQTVTGSDSVPDSKITRHLPQIDGYQILSILGHGGMGIVYRAVQTALSRTVALKVLPAIIGTVNPTAVARFRREASAAGRLHHTNIVPIYDFGESHDSYYFAMELIAGQPLNVLIPRVADEKIASAPRARVAEWLEEQLSGNAARAKEKHPQVESAPSTEPTSSHSTSTRGGAYYQQVAHWMADTADGLHYAHGQGIIHRDIKPGNLILSTDSRIMIADFGLAKTADDESYTATGALIGTLRYLSPEQAMAKRIRVDHRTDIYSLGATMYELLCFQPAFPGSDQKEVLGAIIARDPVAPQRINGAVPAELGTICLKCLEKLPDARYSTARALADDLRRFLHDLPIVARSPGPIRRMRKFVRRHRAVTAAAAVGLVFTVATGWAFQRHEHRLTQADHFASMAWDAAGNQRWKLAADLFTKALELDSQNVDALANFAMMKKDLYNSIPDPNLLLEANELSGRAVAVDPQHAVLWNAHGVILKKLGRFAEAASAYHRAIEIDPNFSAAWENLGVVTVLGHDLERGKEQLATSCKLAGTTEKLCQYHWRNLATLEVHFDDPLAVEHVEKALVCNPGDPATMRVRAKLFLDLEGYTDADQAVQSARFVNLLIPDAIAKRLLARAHLESGEFAEAGRQAALAIERGDMKTVNYFIRAIAEAQQGHRAEASRHYAKALEHWPDGLREKGTFVVTAPKGVLWFESADLLLHLQRRAEGLLVEGAGGS